jgi:hypothetical protein
MNNTYWDRRGEFQSVLELIESKVDYEKRDLGLGVGISIAQKYLATAHAYKRYYNDGDIPKGFGYKSHFEIQQYLEKRANRDIYEVGKKMGLLQ